ncbi:N-6 DNA methylase [Actinoplanes sp. NPDC051633]|uniref:HsdM family class I SAM-dependent methyltransferase n=1 Tax=Actinoplanes sp. NPDC051633 TaxID=3155670 RepID=UPI00342A5605
MALLQNLAQLRQTIPEGNPTRRQALDVVVGGSLVASYLADRGILNADHLRELTAFPDLQAVLLAGRGPAQALFEGLAARFNGDVFGPVPEMLQFLEDADIDGVAALLRGDDLLTGQQSLWPFDFSVLPADLVSSIYEQLLEDSRSTDSAYYTPKFLVDTLLDEIVPWRGDGQLKLIDLACGSGAFMTEAFRRLVYRQRTRVGRELTYEELQRILLDNVFGVELNIDSARIAVFGLYLALLEELDPPTIWDTAVLPRLLGKNVVVSDAFEDHALASARFDAVVSNPPWKSRLTPAAERFVAEERRPVADKQIAQAFLWLAAKYLRPGGSLGLIMPSKPLLHNRSTAAQSFRSALFEELNVRAIVDLSAVRRSIFATAIAPAAVIVASTPEESLPCPPDTRSATEIVYVAAHPRPMSATTDALVITPEEVRPVSYRQALHRPDLWKVLLWGSQRDLELLDRLRLKFPSTEQVASERGWTYGQGYQVGGGDSNDASHLFGLPIIPTEAVTHLRLNTSEFEEFTLPTLHRPRDPQLFRGPHVLVRRTMVDGRLAAALVDQDAVFPNGTLGFAGPGDRPLLMALAATIVSSLGNYFHFMTSASWGVERDFVELNEHLSLPLATPSASQSSELARLFTLAQDGQLPNVREAIDDVVFNMYELSNADRARVLDRLGSGLERFRRPRANSVPVSDATLSRYANTIHEALTATLLDLYVETQIHKGGPYRTVTVTLTDGAPPSRDARPVMPQVDMQRIVEMNAGFGTGASGVVAEPAGFFIEADTVYVVKTADPDRWSIDSALDDAERILTALAFGS